VSLASATAIRIELRFGRGLNITYNITSTLYNTGDEDLSSIVYTDTDINSTSLLLDILRGDSYFVSNLVVVQKAASNTEYEFELGTAVIGALSFYSNRPKVKIPGYGGPADAIVYSPISIPISTSFDTRIKIDNQNPDIGQDFTIDYWITSNDELINYSSGQQTIYVSALGGSNLTASLTSPSSAGNYKFKALVTWAGGSASGFDSFEVTGEEPPTESPVIPPGGGGGGIIEDEEGVNVTVEVEGVEGVGEVGGAGEGGVEGGEIICNPPYIRHRIECCLDEDNNLICDIDELDKGITGRFVENLGEININYSLWGWLLLLLIILFILYKLIRRLIKNMKKGFKRKSIMKLKEVIGLKVYCLGGFEIGKVVDIVIKGKKIDSLKIKLHRKHRKKNKKSKKKKKEKSNKRVHGIFVDYKYVHNIGHIVLIDERINEFIDNINL